MAVTYGFYNALNHDRVYDALQMSSIFDGIIRDGVFSTIGESLICKASGTGLIVNVGSGRAWFNHTWTLNDTDYPVEAEESEVVLDRIDAIVLEVNQAVEVRANSIKFIKGTPSSNPERPTLTHNSEVNQYALAYVSVRAGQTTIFDSDITNVVGTDETPFITGLLQQVSVENLLIQWNDDFYRYFNNFKTVSTDDFNTWLSSKVSEYNAWYADMQAEGAADLAEFDAWFQHMKDQLDTDAAGHLQAEIDALAQSAEKGSIITVTTSDDTLINKTVTIVQNEQSVTSTFNSSKVAIFPSVPMIGNMRISSSNGTLTAISDVNIPYFGRYEFDLEFWSATIDINTYSSSLYGRTITVSKNGTTVGTTSFDSSGHATYKVHETGVYKISATDTTGKTYTQEIEVTEETAYNVKLGYTMYGMRVNGNESVPGSMISYHVQYEGDNVENYDFDPAGMNYSADKFSYGDWSEDNFFMPKPVLISQDTQDKIYLNPNNYTVDVDGNDVSSYLTGTSGNYNAMMEWGRDGRKIWYKVVPDSDNNRSANIYFCDEQADDGFKCWSFYDADGNQIEHFYTRIYPGSNISNVLRSLSGKTPNNTTAGATQISYARANNKNSKVEWYITQYADWVLINLLLMLIGRSTDIQATYGNGNYTGGQSASSLKTTGLLNNKGLFYGTTANGSCKVFGMENYYGDASERMAGLILNNGTILYKLTYSTVDGSSAAGYIENDNAPTNYLTGPSIATNLSNSGIKEQQFGTNGSMLPKTFAGSTSTYYCDCIWSSTGVTYALVGGACAHGLAGGAFMVALSLALSYSSWGVVASLSLKPLAS